MTRDKFNNAILFKFDLAPGEELLVSLYFLVEHDVVVTSLAQNHPNLC